MQRIIDTVGENNILIIFVVIILIIIALFVILLIERKNKLKYFEEFERKDDFEEQSLNIEEKQDEGQEQEKIVYEENLSKTEAKKAIEEAAKKLVYEEENDIIGQTFFEKMQEENSIISYDELVSKNIDYDKENDKVLEDEGNEPITIDELYSFKEENTIKEEDDEVVKETKSFKINTIDETKLPKEEEHQDDEMIYYVNSESKKFKNSEVISPVFGIKRDVIYKKEYNELGETINIKELDMEIKRTEEFLKELKKLKSKLD